MNMYKKLNEKEINILNEIIEITDCNYLQESYGELIDCNEFMLALEDLLKKYQKLEVEYQEYQEDVRMNYKFVGDESDYYDWDYARDMRGVLDE